MKCHQYLSSFCDSDYNRVIGDNFWHNVIEQVKKPFYYDPDRILLFCLVSRKNLHDNFLYFCEF